MIMKKYSIYALMSAIALTGAICFSACSSKDDLTEEVNSTFDPATNTIKANFSLALTSSLKRGAPSTRMSSVNTQASGNFLGMKNIALIPFDILEKIAPSSGGVLPTRIAGASNVNIPTSISASTSQIHAVDYSYNYHFLDVIVPVGTGAFLFYGLAENAILPSDGSATAADKFANGILDTGTADFTTGNPEDFHFDLVPIHTETAEDAQCTALLNYIAAIAAAADATDASKTWASSTDETLQGLYTAFTGMKAGSANAIRQVVRDLYSSIYLNADGVSVAIADAIKTHASDVMAGDPATKTGALEFDATIGEAANTYPRNINLPDGAAVIEWSTATPKTPSAVVTGNKSKGIAGLNKYVFPASLPYFANSTIRVSNSKKDAAYTTYSSWSDILSSYDAWVDGSKAVTSSTRDIALTDDVQYGVGRLELKVKASDALDGTDKTATGGANNDGKKVLYDRNGAEVVIPEGGFPVTGVFIGAQRGVKWDFTPVDAVQAGGGSTEIINEYTIYDNAVSGINAGTTAVGANHTLAMETDPGASVNIAVELENNSGQTFMGEDGIVPANGRFYLVAELKVVDGTQPSSITLNQIFKQDYRTNVNLTIKPNTTNTGTSTNPNYAEGLGAAYNTIPDLGTPTLRLGFSVDLTWEQGLTFNLEM